MKILHLNTRDHGGAAKAAYRLHQNFINAGHNSKILVKSKSLLDNNIIQVNDSSFLSRIKSRFFHKIAHEIFEKKKDYSDYFFKSNLNYVSFNSITKSLPFTPDIIIVHWISDFINSKYLYQLHKQTDAPIIWYLMDMAAFTGGCHYAWNCRNYMQQCGKCPAINSSKKYDWSYNNWKRKKNYIHQTNITAVAPTKWLYEQVKNSSIFDGKRIEQIMLSIDTKIFAPKPKSEIRQKLKLPPDKFIIFFGAESFDHRRKGMKYLSKALDILYDNTKTNDILKNKIFVIYASKANDKFFMKIPFLNQYLGYLNTDDQLAMAYQAANVFVCPSIEDSGPMMINESIMCGTPVVAFKMGAATDLVHSGETGYSAELKNSEDLAKGILSILQLNNEKALTMADNCRTLGLALCHPDQQLKKFEELFKMLNCTDTKQ